MNLYVTHLYDSLIRHMADLYVTWGVTWLTYTWHDSLTYVTHSYDQRIRDMIHLYVTCDWTRPPTNSMCVTNDSFRYNMTYPFGTWLIYTRRTKRIRDVTSVCVTWHICTWRERHFGRTRTRNSHTIARGSWLILFFNIWHHPCSRDKTSLTWHEGKLTAHELEEPRS